MSFQQFLGLINIPALKSIKAWLKTCAFTTYVCTVSNAFLL
jgi:hypothetical protein